MKPGPPEEYPKIYKTLLHPGQPFRHRFSRATAPVYGPSPAAESVLRLCSGSCSSFHREIINLNEEKIKLLSCSAKEAKILYRMKDMRDLG